MTPSKMNTQQFSKVFSNPMIASLMLMIPATTPNGTRYNPLLFFSLPFFSLVDFTKTPPLSFFNSISLFSFQIKKPLYLFLSQISLSKLFFASTLAIDVILLMDKTIILIVVTKALAAPTPTSFLLSSF